VVEALQGLVDLSRLDTDLQTLEEERSGIPARREACAARRAEADARVSESREVLGEAELAQRRAESDLQDREALLQKLEAQQSQVKTNEAYTALLHEMDQARESISEAETRILEAMDQIEAVGARLATSEQEARGTAGRIDEEERSLDEREKALEQRITELRSNRGEAVARLEAPLVERYEKILSRRQPAVVVVQGESCMGCRVDIPPQAFIEIRRGEEIISCAFCHRILIHEDQLRASAGA
jgi:predicted  nucleic acid-binding Zn-ribbon protein